MTDISTCVVNPEPKSSDRVNVSVNTGAAVEKESLGEVSSPGGTESGVTGVSVLVSTELVCSHDGVDTLIVLVVECRPEPSTSKNVDASFDIGTAVDSMIDVSVECSSKIYLCV